MSRVIAAFAQFFDDTGAPLENGWLEFLVSGTTGTQKNTFSDKDYLIPNSNPVQLDAAGRCPNVFGTGAYRVKSYTNNPVTKAPGSLIQEFDPVWSDLNPLNADEQFAEWDYYTTYDAGNIVTYQQNYYKAILSSNQGNTPSSTSAYWQQIDFFHMWNANATYSEDQLVVYDNTLYVSIQDNNTNHQPDVSPAWWSVAGGGTILINWEEDGTTFQPMVSGYDLGSVTNLLGDVYLLDSSELLLGNAQDLSIQHNGTNSLITNLTGILNIDSQGGNLVFSVGGADRWQIDSSNGQLMPFGNVLYDIGTGVNHLRHIYIGDLGRVYFGQDQDASIWYDGADLQILTTDDLVITCTAGNVLVNTYQAITEDFSLWGVDVSPDVADYILTYDAGGNVQRLALGNIPSTGASSEADIYQDLMAESKFQNVTYDDFGDQTLVDSTTMDYDQNNTRYNFTAAEVITSDDLFDSASGLDATTLTEAMVSAIFTDSGSGTIEFTSNGGSNWQTVENNVPFTIGHTPSTPPVIQLRYTAGGTGYIESWAVLYNVDQYSVVDPLNLLEFQGYYPEMFRPNPNLFINGQFDIWQRATSVSGPLTGTYTCVDRFICYDGSDGVANITRETFTAGQTDVPSNPIFYLNFELATAATGGSPGFHQKIDDVRTVQNETVTLSFWARLNSGTCEGDLITVQSYGSGGSSSDTTTFDPVNISSSSWTKYTFTIDVPSVSGKTIGTDSALQVGINFDLGNTFDVDFANFKLERGSYATAYEKQKLEEVLAECQRYFVKFTALGSNVTRFCTGLFTASNTCKSIIHLPVRMRSTTVTLDYFDLRILHGSTASTISNLSLAASSDLTPALDSTGGTATVGQVGVLSADGNVNSYISFSAEI